MTTYVDDIAEAIVKIVEAKNRYDDVRYTRRESKVEEAWEDMEAQVNLLIYYLREALREEE